MHLSELSLESRSWDFAAAEGPGASSTGRSTLGPAAGIRNNMTLPYSVCTVLQVHPNLKHVQSHQEEGQQILPEV